MEAVKAVTSRYETFVRRNAGWLLPLEDTARSLTIFLPGRFSESELQCEAIHTFLNLSSLSHDRILGRPDRSVVCDIKCTAPNTDTPEVRRLSNVLTFFHYTEVLIEMIATRVFRRPISAAMSSSSADPRMTVLGEGLSPILNDSKIGGEVSAIAGPNLLLRTAEAAGMSSYTVNTRGKWLVMLLVEAIKVYCRLRMLYHNRGRMLVTPSQEEVVLAMEKKKQEHKLSEHIQSHPQSEAAKYPDLTALYVAAGRGSGSGSAYGPHPHGTFSKYLRPPVHPRDAVTFRPTTQETVGEVLFFVRPLIYVVGRLLCREGSWTPFITSLLTDIASKVLTTKYSTLTPSEQAEVGRRMSLMAFYLLRSPLFDRFTKVPLVRAAQFLGRIPVVGVLFGNLFDLLCALQSHYFYTSAS